MDQNLLFYSKTCYSSPKTLFVLGNVENKRAEKVCNCNLAICLLFLHHNYFSIVIIIIVSGE